jgi:hypothetical protein
LLRGQAQKREERGLVVLVAVAAVGHDDYTHHEEQRRE